MDRITATLYAALIEAAERDYRHEGNTVVRVRFDRWGRVDDDMGSRLVTVPFDPRRAIREARLSMLALDVMRGGSVTDTSDWAWGAAAHLSLDELDALAE